MKIVKIIKSLRNASEDEIKNFIYKNMSQEMVVGLEYDDPKTIARALKLFGIDPKLAMGDENNAQQSIKATKAG